MAIAAAELLAAAGVRGSVPMGGSSTNPPPTPAFPGFVVVDDFLAWPKSIVSLATMANDDISSSTIAKTETLLLLSFNKHLQKLIA